MKNPEKKPKLWNPFDLNRDGKMNFIEKSLMYQSFLYATENSDEDDSEADDLISETAYLEKQEEDDAWRSEHEEEAEEYGLFMDLYSCEDDFLDALNEEKYSWRDSYSDAFISTGIDPDDYETEDEYLEALNDYSGSATEDEENIEAVDDTEYVSIWDKIDSIEEMVRSGNIDEAQLVFDAVLFGDEFDADDKDSMVSNLIYRFYDSDNVDYLETYRDTLFQSIYKVTDPELLKEVGNWQDKLFKNIDEILTTSDNYAFSRIYEWRNKYKEYIKSKWYTDPCDYQTEAEFLADLDEEQNGWKRHFKDVCEKYGLNVNDYEDEYDCRDAIDDARREIREGKRETYYAEHNENGKKYIEIEDDGTVYSFCLVEFPHKNMKPLAYLSNGIRVSVHDEVLVPFGKDNTPTPGVVVSVIKCTASAAPYPPQKTKKIIQIIPQDLKS